MKKFKALACCMAFLMLFSFTACGGTKDPGNTGGTEDPGNTGGTDVPDDDDLREPGLGDGTFQPDYDFDYNPHYDIPEAKPKNVTVVIHEDAPVTFADGTKSYKGKPGQELPEIVSATESPIAGWYDVNNRAQTWKAEDFTAIPQSSTETLTIAPYYAMPGINLNPGKRGDNPGDNAGSAVEFVHSIDDGPSMGTVIGHQNAAVGNYLGFQMEISLPHPAKEGDMNANYGVVSPEFAEKYVMRLVTQKTPDNETLPAGDYHYHNYFFNYGSEAISFRAFYGAGGFRAVDPNAPFTEGIVTLQPLEGVTFDSVYHNTSESDKNVLTVFVFEEAVEHGVLGVAVSRYDPDKPDEALFTPTLPYGGAVKPDEEPAAGQLLTLSPDYAARFASGVTTRKVTVGGELPQILYTPPMGETLAGWYNADDPAEYWPAGSFAMPDRELTIAPYFAHHGDYMQPGGSTDGTGTAGFFYAAENGFNDPAIAHRGAVLPVHGENDGRYNYLGEKFDFDVGNRTNTAGEHGIVVTSAYPVTKEHDYKFHVQFFNYGKEELVFTPYFAPPQGENGSAAEKYTSAAGQEIASLGGAAEGKITLGPNEGILIPAFQIHAAEDAGSIYLVLIFESGSALSGSLGIGISDATQEEDLHRVTFDGNGGYFNGKEEADSLTLWLAEGTGLGKYGDFLGTRLNGDSFYTPPEGKTPGGWYNTGLSSEYTHEKYDLNEFGTFRMGNKDVVVAPYFEVSGTKIPVGQQNNNGKWPGTDADKKGYEAGSHMAGIQTGYTASPYDSFTVVAGQPYGRVWSFSTVTGAAKDEKPSSLTNDSMVDKEYVPTAEHGAWFRIISAYEGKEGANKLVLKNKTITFHVAFENFGSEQLKFRFLIVESGHDLTKTPHWYNEGNSVTLAGGGGAGSKTSFDFDVTYSAEMGDNYNVMPILWFDTDVTDGHLGFACSWEWKEN